MSRRVVTDGPGHDLSACRRRLRPPSNREEVEPDGLRRYASESRCELEPVSRGGRHRGFATTNRKDGQSGRNQRYYAISEVGEAGRTRLILRNSLLLHFTACRRGRSPVSPDRITFAMILPLLAGNERTLVNSFTRDVDKVHKTLHPP
jgi:hypothetical protein